MRLWHYEMLEYLPIEILLKTFNEIFYIIYSIKSNLILDYKVKRVEEFNKSHLYLYLCMVVHEIHKRGIDVNAYKVSKSYDFFSDEERQISSRIEKDGTLFESWHDNGYYLLCYLELNEMFLSDERLISKEILYKLSCKKKMEIKINDWDEDNV